MRLSRGPRGPFGPRADGRRPVVALLPRRVQVRRPFSGRHRPMPPMGAVRYGHGSDTASFRTASSPSGVGRLPHARVLIRAPHAGGAPEGAKGGDQYGIRPSVHIRDRYGIGWLVLRLRSMRDQPLHGG